VARHQWEHLPSETREAVTARGGPISFVEHATTGSVADFAATLTTAIGRIFCKGAELDTARTGQLRNQIRLNKHLPADLVPRLQWHLERRGWLIAAFDHVPGRSADLRPGSPDLPAVAAALSRMTVALTPCPPVNVQPAAARWGQLLDPAVLAGNTLLHTDMTHNNFLVSGNRAQVVDWSVPCRGAAWLDTARMLVRLIRAGHTPVQVEAWAALMPSWQNTTSQALDAFAGALAKLSRRLRDTTAAPHLADMADAADTWLRYRLHSR
jgi:hypothetical protein